MQRMKNENITYKKAVPPAIISKTYADNPPFKGFERRIEITPAIKIMERITG